MYSFENLFNPVRLVIVKGVSFGLPDPFLLFELYVLPHFMIGNLSVQVSHYRRIGQFLLESFGEFELGIPFEEVPDQLDGMK